MPKIDQKNIYRVLDANFNRVKEGLRVCEDVCRFILNDKVSTGKFKKLRHDLNNAFTTVSLKKLIEERDIVHDIGKESKEGEFNRKNARDIFYANSQRVKESLRVLEEFTKLLDKKVSIDLKRMRYNVYALEQKTIEKL